MVVEVIRDILIGGWLLLINRMFIGMREKEKEEQNEVEEQNDRVTKDTSKSKDWAAADLEKVCFYFVY